MVSNNGMFFAIMQSDGNFCVYRGSGPDDSHGLLWRVQGLSPSFVILEETGMFSLFVANGPEDIRTSMPTARPA